MHRRHFLQSAAASTAVAALSMQAQARAKDLANDNITVAVIGIRGRGQNLMETFAGRPKVEVKYLCDLDPSVLTERSDQLTKQTGRSAETVADFRRVLDDPAVNAIVLGTPDHWHALPTIMACQAGKDVYVEKPDGHNLLEGRTMVAAARKHGRVVQLGMQSRSTPHILEAIEYIRAGNLGRVLLAKAWESTKQGNLGHPADGTPPEGVDYDFWLGPAPSRPFNPLRFHGNWRWFFDYGTGDLGNDGVHRLDVARWALETAIAAKGGAPLGLPKKATAAGGKFYFDDAQEWPDTLLVSYEYPGHLLTYEMRVWAPYPLEEEPEGSAVYGDEGSLVISTKRWRAFDARGNVVAAGHSGMGDHAHAQNFLDCMRTREKPAADLETVGHPSSVLCHMGNVAWRTGRTVKFDAENYTFPGDETAQQYVTRPSYRSPWLLPSLAEV